MKMKLFCIIAIEECGVLLVVVFVRVFFLYFF